MAEPGADIGGKPVAVDAGEVAAEHGITREEADAWAARSHERWFAAAENGFFDGEVVPLEVERGRRKTKVEADESPRRGSTPDVLAGFPTVFDGPIVTAANAPGQNAGSCFIALASREAVEEHGLRRAFHGARVGDDGGALRRDRDDGLDGAVTPRQASDGDDDCQDDSEDWSACCHSSPPHCLNAVGRISVGSLKFTP